MKTKLLLLLAFLLPLAAHAADDLSTALQKGLFEEEANQNLPAAIQAYQSLLAASDDQRKLAATALFRLGECYRKLGQTNDAIAQYQRLIRDFTDQTTLATLSRQNLVGLGVGPTPASAVSISSTVVSSTSIEAQELARTERILAQLSGLDFSQVRGLVPTLIPDADSERYEKLVADAQQRAFGSLGQEKDRWLKKEAEYIAQLAERFEVIKRRLEDRATQLRSQVAKQSAEAGRETSTSGAAQAATAALRAEAARADALLKQLQSMTTLEAARVLPTVAPDDLLNSLLEKRAQAERNLATLNVSFANTHPDVKAAEATLKNLNMQIDERVRGIVKGLSIKAAALKQQTDEPTGVAAPIDEEEQEIRRIQALIKDSPDLINAPNVEVTKVRSGELMLSRNGTLLHKAASLGQLRVVTFLLDHGADIGARDQSLSQNTPLHWAALNGHRAMVELLLSRKADPNAILIPDGSTPLLLATRKSFRSVCEALLARGANPNLPNRYGSTPLQEAAESGDEAILRLLLAKGAEVNPKDYSGSTALHYASSTNVARLLLERGADINAQNDKGQSPLHEKASLGNRELVELLLKNKADAMLKNKGGMTPLHLAASEGRANVIALLIQGGADPNDQESRTAAPLHYAIQKESGSRTGFSDYPATLTALLAGGANPNTPGKNGSTPLYQAASQGFDQMVELLLKAGADPNLNSGGGYRPIHPALDPRRERMLEALLSHGADPGARNGDGQIPLGRAAEIGSKEAVALLLKYKADPNGKSRQGQTPLHIAVANNRRDIVDLLLAAKANPNIIDAQGLSPLDYAKQRMQSQQSGVQSFVVSMNTDSVSSESPGSNASSATLADKLRQAGARDWAPRPGQITVTRRSTGKTQAVFTKGTNDWNRHSLLEVMAFIYWGKGSIFPFPDLSKLTITRLDPASGATKEFTIDLPNMLAAEDCKTDQWLEWGDLIDVPEGEHKLDEKWAGLPSANVLAFTKCLDRKVTLSVNRQSKEVSLAGPGTGQWRSESVNGVMQYLPARSFRLRDTVLGSGLLLTSSDTNRVKVKRTDASSGRVQEWTFDLSKGAIADDLWLRDGDVIEVPEKP